MSELTAADVRDALLWLARDNEYCRDVALYRITESKLGSDVLFWADISAHERAAMADEARAEGER